MRLRVAAVGPSLLYKTGVDFTSAFAQPTNVAILAHERRLSRRAQSAAVFLSFPLRPSLATNSIHPLCALSARRGDTEARRPPFGRGGRGPR